MDRWEVTLLELKAVDRWEACTLKTVSCGQVGGSHFALSAFSSGHLGMESVSVSDPLVCLDVSIDRWTLHSQILSVACYFCRGDRLKRPGQIP